MISTGPTPLSESGGAGKTWSLVVIGAGAAGLLSAIFAARAGAQVLLLETRSRPGAKIRVSGGGRCNVLPSRADLEHFSSGGSMKAVRNVLGSWPLEEVREFFAVDLGIALKVEPNGKVFPQSDDAREVVDALLAECARVGVQLQGDFRVTGLRREDDSFTVVGERAVVRGRCVVLATGGLSLPRTGSDGGGLRLSASAGHSLVTDHPALVPLETEDDRLQALAGLSLPVEIQVCRGNKVIERCAGDFLFTHRGFSGPVALDVSRHVTEPRPEGAATPGGGGPPRDDAPALRVAWRGPDAPDWDRLLRQGGARHVSTILRDELPRRLVDVLLERVGLRADEKLSELSRDKRRQLVEVLTEFPLPVSGNEGYAKAEVTAGGVPLAEVHLKTLESRRVPGLYFAGEILDVIGHIGGYNFLWAWVTGKKAGEAAAGALVRDD